MRLAPLLAVASLASVLGCGKPEPPVLTTRDATVTRVDVNGINVVVRMSAYNPNRIGLDVQNVTAQLLLDGQYDLGTATIQNPVTLAPRAHTPIEVPIAMRWSNVGLVGLAAATAPTFPFVAQGTVRIGGPKIAIELPFRAEGTISRQQVLDAAARAIPLPQGLDGLPALPPIPLPAPPR